MTDEQRLQAARLRRVVRDERDPVPFAEPAVDALGQAADRRLAAGSGARRHGFAARRAARHPNRRTIVDEVERLELDDREVRPLAVRLLRGQVELTRLGHESARLEGLRLRFRDRVLERLLRLAHGMGMLDPEASRIVEIRPQRHGSGLDERQQRLAPRKRQAVLEARERSVALLARDLDVSRARVYPPPRVRVSTALGKHLPPRDHPRFLDLAE